MAPPDTVEPRHQSGGLAVALAKLDLDALTVADAVADVAAMAGENVTTAIRADLKEFRAEVNARFETFGAAVNARFETFDAKVNARFETFSAEVNARFEALQGEIARLGSETNARFETLGANTDARFEAVMESIRSLRRELQSVQRELATLRWMIGVGFTLLSIFLALSTFLRG